MAIAAVSEPLGGDGGPRKRPGGGDWLKLLPPPLSPNPLSPTPLSWLGAAPSLSGGRRAPTNSLRRPFVAVAPIAPPIRGGTHL